MFHLSSVQHLAAASVHDFRPLVAVWVRGVSDDVNRVCDFDLCSFHNVLYLKKKVVGKYHNGLTGFSLLYSLFANPLSLSHWIISG
jgi:hypothetical protein